MKLWRLKEPNYSTDQERKLHNGNIEFPFGLPGVNCCETWSSCDVSELECPYELRQIREFNDGWPVSAERLEELRDELRSYSLFHNLGSSELPPGLRLFPARLSAPEFVENDFLWSSLEAPLVSLRVATLLQKHCPNDFVAVPVENHSVYKGVRAKLNSLW